MRFREWLILNENIEANLDRWLGDIVKYAKPEEKAVLDSLARNQHVTLDPPQMANPYRDSTISALKRKGSENLNWLAFSLGYLSAKKYRTEDLEMAVDVTRQLISSGEIPKNRIGSKGWLLTGREVYPKVQEYLLKSQQRSNREERRMRKRGEVAGDDERLIGLVAQEENIKLYKLPAMGSGTERGLPKDDEEIEARHRVLCKYGKGTEWCTASPTGDYHEIYLNNNIYIVHVDDKPLYQFVDCNDDDNHQFMNVKDEEVNSVEPKVFSLIRKNAKTNTECYELSVRFKDLDDYESSDEDAKKNISYRTVYEFLKNNVRQPMVVVHKLGENAHMITDALFSLQVRDCVDTIHDILNVGGLRSRGWRNYKEEFADWMVDSLSVKPRQAPDETWDYIEWAYIQLVQNLLTFSGNFEQALRKLAPIINEFGIGDELLEHFLKRRTLDELRHEGVDLDAFIAAGIQIQTANKLKYARDPLEMAKNLGTEVDTLGIYSVGNLMGNLDANDRGDMREFLFARLDALVDDKIKSFEFDGPPELQALSGFLDALGIDSSSTANLLSAPIRLERMRKVIAQYERHHWDERRKSLSRHSPEEIERILDSVREARTKTPGPSPEDIRKAIEDEIALRGDDVRPAAIAENEGDDELNRPRNRLPRPRTGKIKMYTHHASQYTTSLSERLLN